MGGRKSRTKGRGYEIEIRDLLRSYGYDAKRSGHRQVQIGDGSPDVSGLPGFHPECKRRKGISIYKWIEQAEETEKEGRTPIVFCRGDHKESLVILRAVDFLDLITEE